MASLLDTLSEEEREQLRKKKPPQRLSPMLATLTDDYFSDPDWLFERKFDGVRCLVHKHRSSAVALRSRNHKSQNSAFPELVDAFDDLDAGDFIADGEIVAFDGSVTSFAKLQHRVGVTDPHEARASNVRVFIYLFDLLYLDGHVLDDLPLRTRKRLLKRAIDFADPIRYTEHRNEHGERFLREACRKKWEGLIAKKASSTYRHSRSRDWLKFKCINQQEFVIGGYTDPQGERTGFGALLLGYYDGDDLHYAGRVGTGFDDDLLKSLKKKLRARARKTSPFANGPDDEKGVHWVTPSLVGEVGFTEWTQDDRLRHPRFLGLRHDKQPKKVVREEPEQSA